MPFEIMDQRGGTASSRFFEDICFPPERQIGFWKQYTHSDYPGVDGRAPSSGCKLVAAPLERFSPAWALPVDDINLPQSLPTRDQKEMLPIGTGGENMPKTSWNSIDQPKSLSNVSLQSSSYSLGSNTIGISGTQWESSLFSSSVSDIFSRKLRLSGDEVHSHQRVKPIISSHEEYEAFDSIEEIEAQTIGNLLPAEDDLFSGVTDEFGHKTHANRGDDLEDFDLFSSGGGLELEGEDRMSVGKRDSILCGGGSNGSVVGEHPYGEHPSRTLFVRNINSNVEDSELEAIFKQFGDIRNLYTACKHRGFVMISYYDIRASRNAMRTLQNKPLKRRKLDIHYSIPKDNPSDKDIYQGTLLVLNLDPSVSKEELHQIFGFYGEIKQIHETTQKHNQKFIEYYDIRAAEAALSALNQSEIAGKQIKLEPMGAILSPVGAFSESHQSSSVPANSLSPAAMASVGKQFGRHETNCSVDEMKFANQRISSFHPHSLPEYHDNLVDGIPYHSSSTLGDRSGSFGSKVTERIGSRHIQGVGSNGHLMDINGGAFGSPGNGNCSVPGHHYIWNHNRSGQQHPSNRMIWGNSPSFVNGVQVHHLPHMTGFPGARPVMLNTAPAQHHIGSAPAVNPSLWDRRQAYLGESPEVSSFHLGSLGSVGFPVSSPPHPMEITSRSMFSHVAGNCMDIAKIAGQRSSTQMCHVFPGRNPMISMPSSFDSPMDRVRNLSHRRIESNSSHSDKKQYELDLDRILRGDDSRTTLMIKNIPNKYTSKMLLAAIDEFCRGTYDFIYLPIDFKNKCNVGYAFINMTDPQQIIQFHKAFNGKKWEKFNSEKVATLAYARIQGKAALIAHFQNSSLMNEDKRCRPILFHTDGPNAGDPEPFPMGSNIRSRLGKPRSSSNGEHHHHGSPSTFPNGEDSSSGSRSPSGSE